jgi:putative redox protein
MAIQVIRDTTRLMRHEIQIGAHRITTDGTVEDGGEDLGPSPHDLYDAALGACKALTLLWYAKRKAIPVENITVTIDRDASQERAGVYRLHATIMLTGGLNAAQREDLLKVASKCPIHKLMTEVTTEIATSLAP